MEKVFFFKKQHLPLLCLFFLLMVPSALALREPFDHSLWDAFLKAYVNREGQVHYPAAKRDSHLLTEYLEKLAQIDLKEFETSWPREEKLAVWLNAYHAGVIKMILDHYPVRSIHDISGVWDLPVIRIHDQSFSLNGIRSNQLMEAFRDEKIHVALACGAKSCPRFRREAYTGPRVEGQLFLATREFVNDPVYLQITPGQKAIFLSQLFKWYEQDFTLDFGSAENDQKLSPQQMAVLSFIAHYLEDAKKIEYLEEGRYKIKYLPFEWALNEGASPSA